MEKSKEMPRVKSKTLEIQGIKNGMMRFLVCAMVFLVASAGGYGPRCVEASPDEPVISDGGATVTLSGNQSQGITNVPGWVYSDFSTPPVTTVNIRDLTADILNATYPLSAIYIYDAGDAGEDGDDDPYDGDDGKDGGSSSNMTLNYDGGDFSLAPVVPYEGIHIDNHGGSGGDGGQGNSGLAITASGGDGGDGASSGVTTLNSNGTIQVLNGVQAAIEVTGNGGGGGDGGAAKAGTAAAHGGDGGNGGAGNNVVVSSSSTIGSSTMAPMIGITAVSKGGSGGDGNDGKTGSKGVGGNGGSGANGAMASVDNSGDIFALQVGISAKSRSGAGGAGGLGGGTDGQGGYGGDAGTAGQVTVANTGAINVLQAGKGIDAESIGYAGGNGGEGDGVGGIGHDGGNGGSAGAVDVANAGAISVQMPGSYGIYALSEAGDGGNGGDGAGVGGKGGDGGVGGSGGTVSVGNQADIAMLGDKSQGILAASRGGAGGDGGQGDGMVGIGGAGEGSGPGGDVAVDNSGVIQTQGDTSRGIFLQSVGGYGGDSGASGGFYAYSAGGNSGGDGGAVDLENTASITTFGEDSDALFAQSVGGGGGSGGSSGGVIAIGGTGDAGGDGGEVAVSNSGSLKTLQDEASGLVAQSVGGGGGDGGATISGGIDFGVALGGNAGSGGDGGSVGVDSSNTIDTAGDNAIGILAQSAGGGGGNGGYSITAAPGAFVNCTVAIGGSGGDGGKGGEVNIDNESAIHTEGENSHGILAESLGGGGGVAGYSVSVSATPAFSAVVSLGGSGGDGGGAQNVTLVSSGDIATYGDSSDGILAQSIGGGGGVAGYSASGSLGVSGSFAYGLGGTGGGGGNAGEVRVTNNNAISTFGSASTGLYAQSLGGGGGEGAMSIDASLGLLSGSVSLGGSGGSGGDGSLVEILNYGDIATAGEQGFGIHAQSVGGGGGKGGLSLSEDVGIGAISFSLGGSGDGGGYGGIVNVDNSGDITTKNSDSHGILAQSVGGGGGVGGIAETTALSFGVQAGDVTIPCMSLAVSVGGSGGPGSDAQKVTVQNSGDILTYKKGSSGIQAESTGGGGGDAGWATSAAASAAKGETFALDVSLALGGTGGSGGDGGEVEVVNDGGIHTEKDESPGISAQSTGGGGGNGGVGVAGTVEIGNQSTSMQSSVTIGGAGGDGGSGALVAVASSGAIITEGNSSPGIDAQSIGGGGGNGGITWSGDMSLRHAYKADLSVGGTGGDGGSGGDVMVNACGAAINTSGQESHGISAQSVGGGGGHGGSAHTVTWGDFGLEGKVQGNFNLSLSIGGYGGDGDTGGAATVKNVADSATGDAPADISTQGDYSCGIYAQSVGGGGGDGASSFTMALSSEVFSNPEKNQYAGDLQLSASVGGKGGAGNHGGTVEIDNGGKIATQGESAHGICAQSVGGGGGNGGRATTFNYIIPAKAPEKTNAVLNFAYDVTVGGNGGGTGNGGGVAINNDGDIETSGDDASGIWAQTIGGGGGDGGGSFRIPGVPIPGGKAPKDWFLSVFNIRKMAVMAGGNGGSSGNGGDIDIDNSGKISTWGSAVVQVEDEEEEYTLDYNAYGSHGIFAQSVGGGGGTGGSANIGFDFGRIGLGGEGGAGGDGGRVTVANNGAIGTAGDGSHGIWAQSVGGGGGVAGDVVRNMFNITNFNYFGLGVGIGREGGDGGNGGAVTVASSGDIVTSGDDAFGIFAQSVGGGGGTGGMDTGYPEHLIFNGSTFHGSPGDGGAVSVSQAGDILTYGEHGHGIVAQSTSGSGAAGTVNVTLTGNVIAGGYESHGILAQSLGAETCQKITVTVNNGSTVQGGCDTGDCTPGGSTDHSFGVLFLDGADNLLSNHGMIAAADGIGGTAVMQQASCGAPYRGNLTIDNYGAIAGSVDQGDQSVSEDSEFIVEGMDPPDGISIIHFNNMQSSTFNTGSTINLGSGTLANSGTLNVGGATAIQSELTGNFSQSDTGVFATTLNPDGSCGSLQVSGSADLDGILELNYGSGAFTTETTYGILTADSIDGEFSQEAFPDDTLLSVSTEYHSTVVDVTVTPESFTTMAKGSHEMLLAQYHDRLLPLTHHDFGDVHGMLQTLPASEFRSAFASFSPAIYDANAFTTFNVSRQYLNTVRDRLKKARQNGSFGHARWKSSDENEFLAANDSDTKPFSSGIESLSSEKFRGISLAGFGQFGDADEDDGLSGFDYAMNGAAVGADFALNEQFAAGAGFGYAATNIDLDSNFGSTDLDSFFGSVYGTYYTKKFYLEGVFSYGRHSYDNRRRISIGEIRDVAESDYDADAYSASLEAGYDFSFGNWDLRPFASLLYTHLDEEGFRETGADSLDMQIEDNQTDSLSSELGVRLSRSFEMEKGILTPEFTAAWQKDYDSDRHEMAVSFAGEPTGLTVEGRERSDSALLGAGVSFTSHGGGVSVSLQYDGEIAEDFSSHSLFGQIRIPF